MDQLNLFYEAILDNEISEFFAIVILCVLALSAASRIPIKSHLIASPLSGLCRNGPSLLTTLGVLGTFTGIFLGLLEFNVDDIDTSIPQLLSGLKIAFVTSILGIASAIALKIFVAITPDRQMTKDDVTPSTIHSTLESIRQEIVDKSEKETEAFREMKNAISADSDSSLLTQIQKLRSDTKDGQNELIKEFQDFATTMAENNSTALIEALETVIRDFNTQINEQFGDNFKQLNHAVEALLSWQKNYREHIETLEKKFADALQGLQSSEEILRKIAVQTESIPVALEKQEKSIHGISEVTSELNDHLEAVAGLKNQALEAFPTIEKNLGKLTTDLGKSINDTVAKTAESFEIQQSASQSLQEGFQNLLNSSKEVQARFENNIDKSFTSMQSSVDTVLNATQDGISSRFDQFDQEMQEQLIDCIQQLGRKLASLSEKFVDDYAPLTKELQKLVQSMR